MRKIFIWILFLGAFAIPGSAQQILYANLKSLMSLQGDTVSTLQIEKRTKNQIYLTGGGDYRIEARDNSGLTRYVRSRCYAVQVDSAWYVNCRKMRYQRYRFGQWYASAMWVRGKLYFCAQPLGQVAASSAIPAGSMKLGGEVGDALAASGLVHVRVYYELNPETGRSVFVGKDKMLALLSDFPDLRSAFEQETEDTAPVIGKYLKALQGMP